MRLGSVDLLNDNVSRGGIEAEKRLQPGRDKALVEPERKVILVVGHPD